MASHVLVSVEVAGGADQAHFVGLGNEAEVVGSADLMLTFQRDRFATDVTLSFESSADCTTTAGNPVYGMRAVRRAELEKARAEIRMPLG